MELKPFIRQENEWSVPTLRLPCGWTKGIDPLLARTLFWYTGHAIVYFWVLPAYIS